MTITAKNIGRINVWPTYRVARDADTEESKFTGQLTVWQTNEEALANTSHEEEGGGGGGGEPDWVPANAVIHIDLVGGDPQGRAWVAGTGEVAVNTLLGSDPNTENYFSTTSYNPADLTVDGLVREEESPALIGAALAKVLAGTTMRIQLGAQTEDNNDIFMLMGAAGDNGMTFRALGDGAVNISSDSGNVAMQTAADIVNDDAVNAIAFTLVRDDRLDVAANGGVVLSSPLIEEDWELAGDELVAAVIALVQIPIQSITLYDPLPSTAGLSELSEVI